MSAKSESRRQPYKKGCGSVFACVKWRLRAMMTWRIAVRGRVAEKPINKAKDPNLYFYGEKSGIEVVALMLEGGGLRLYEIESEKNDPPGSLR